MGDVRLELTIRYLYYGPPVEISNNRGQISKFNQLRKALAATFQEFFVNVVEQFMYVRDASANNVKRKAKRIE